MMKDIQTFWKLLPEIRRFQYTVDCGLGSKTGWQGEATGTVEIHQCPEQSWIDYIENCQFKLFQSGEVFDLKNRYRWTLLPDHSSIRLEHWRRGHPVHLLDLVVVGEGQLKEAERHVCGQDYYRLGVRFDGNGFEGVWRISGPKKNETLRYHYS